MGRKSTVNNLLTSALDPITNKGLSAQQYTTCQSNPGDYAKRWGIQAAALLVLLPTRTADPASPLAAMMLRSLYKLSSSAPLLEAYVRTFRSPQGAARFVGQRLDGSSAWPRNGCWVIQ